MSSNNNDKPNTNNVKFWQSPKKGQDGYDQALDALLSPNEKNVPGSVNNVEFWQAPKKGQDGYDQALDALLGPDQKNVPGSTKDKKFWQDPSSTSTGSLETLVDGYNETLEHLLGSKPAVNPNKPKRSR